MQVQILLPAPIERIIMTNSERKDINILFHAVDDMYWDAANKPRKRSKIDLVLSQVTEDMPDILILAFLSITIPHKEEFKYRPRVLEIIKKKRPNEPDLWAGLE